MIFTDRDNAKKALIIAPTAILPQPLRVAVRKKLLLEIAAGE